MNGARGDALRRDIVTACAVLADAGHADTPLGGVLTRGDDGVDLVTPSEPSWDEVRANLVVELEPAVTTEDHRPWVCAARHILDARPDLGAVVHTHAIHAVAASTHSEALRPLSHEGCHLVPPDIARLDVILPAGVVAAMTRSPVCLLRAHGLMTAAGTLGEAVALAIYLERSCAINLLAGTEGTHIADADTLAKRAGQLGRPLASWRYLTQRARGTSRA